MCTHTAHAQDKYGAEEPLDPKDYGTSPRVLSHDALNGVIAVPEDLKYVHTKDVRAAHQTDIHGAT